MTTPFDKDSIPLPADVNPHSASIKSSTNPPASLQQPVTTNTQTKQITAATTGSSFADTFILKSFSSKDATTSASGILSPSNAPAGDAQSAGLIKKLESLYTSKSNQTARSTSNEEFKSKSNSNLPSLQSVLGDVIKDAGDAVPKKSPKKEAAAEILAASANFEKRKIIPPKPFVPEVIPHAVSQAIGKKKRGRPPSAKARGNHWTRRKSHLNLENPSSPVAEAEKASQPAAISLFKVRRGGRRKKIVLDEEGQASEIERASEIQVERRASAEENANVEASSIGLRQPIRNELQADQSEQHPSHSLEQTDSSQNLSITDLQLKYRLSIQHLQEVNALKLAHARSISDLNFDSRQRLLQAKLEHRRQLLDLKRQETELELRVLKTKSQSYEANEKNAVQN